MTTQPAVKLSSRLDRPAVRQRSCERAAGCLTDYPIHNTTSASRVPALAATFFPERFFDHFPDHLPGPNIA
jgi:hypothetical protein